MIVLCVIAAVAVILEVVVICLLIAQVCGMSNKRQNYMSRINWRL